MSCSNSVTLCGHIMVSVGQCGPGMRAMCLALDHWAGDQNTGGGWGWPGCVVTAGTRHWSVAHPHTLGGGSHLHGQHLYISQICATAI